MKKALLKVLLVTAIPAVFLLLVIQMAKGCTGTIFTPDPCVGYVMIGGIAGVILTPAVFIGSTLVWVVIPWMEGRGTSRPRTIVLAMAILVLLALLLEPVWRLAGCSTGPRPVLLDTACTILGGWALAATPMAAVGVVLGTLVLVVQWRRQR